MNQPQAKANAPASASAATKRAAANPARLMSLDALRGFDMFWIVGADALVEALPKLSDGRVVRGLAAQLEHVAWAGFHFEDLIFPMFVFIVGVSLVFSLARTIEQHGRAGAAVRIVRRAALLYLLGVFYYGGLSTPFQEIRLLGVLQRIAIAYFFAGLIFCFFKTRGRIIWCVSLLVGYWLVMTWVPVPGGAAGNFAEGQNLANWVDKQYLPLRKWDGDHDPEGLLSTLPAIANCLLGVFAGGLLRDGKRSDLTKVAWLAVAGLILVALGWLWNFQFPVIKKIWTSSFVLVACGYSCLLLGAFHLVIEAWGWRAWAQPFVWVGMNPITIYLFCNLVDVRQIAQRFVGGDFNRLGLGRYGELAVALVQMAITFGICRFLYRRKIFLRV
ncbi:MAG TPA: heparan-alpha-glucosaminide N-acetyltransferase domain-containing protein [Candidatus Acidoferrum sp.]|nr:heparan-alpha-glucosaminide N-acetyltransferase domain-containing protein [Candidatus Acidoferrum sp.]